MSDVRRKWEYTLEDIAAASRVSINTVRDHKQQRFLKPDNLRSVAEYVVGNRMLERLRQEKLDPELDAFGNPV